MSCPRTTLPAQPVPPAAAREALLAPLYQTHLEGLRQQASRGGRALDGGAAFTPVRDNVLLELLDAFDGIKDEREKAAQLQEAIVEAMASLATGPAKNGYAYKVLGRALSEVLG